MPKIREKQKGKLLRFVFAQTIGEEFLDDWLPGMHSDVLLVGVNWNVDLEGAEIEPLDLLEEFEAELD